MSSFCDFRKITFCAVFSFLTQSVHCFSDVLILKGTIKAYLCPNMINFDGVDFSEHHSEEVVSFF